MQEIEEMDELEEDSHVGGHGTSHEEEEQEEAGSEGEEWTCQPSEDPGEEIVEKTNSDEKLETPRDIVRLQKLIDSGLHLGFTEPAPCECHAPPQPPRSQKTQYQSIQHKWDRHRRHSSKVRGPPAIRSPAIRPRDRVASNKETSVRSRETFLRCRNRQGRKDLGPEVDDISMIRWGRTRSKSNEAR